MNLFDIDNLQKDLQILEKQTTQNGFWEDNVNSSIVLKKIKTIKNKCSKYNNIYTNILNLQEMSQLLLNEYDEELAKEILTNTASVRKRFR